jgi:hypothetical protein
MKKLLAIVLMTLMLRPAFAADVDVNQRNCTCVYDPNAAGCTITNPPKKTLDFLLLYKLPYALDGKDLKMSPSVFIRYCSNTNSEPLRYLWNFKDGKVYLTMTY